MCVCVCVVTQAPLLAANTAAAAAANNNNGNDNTAAAAAAAAAANTVAANTAAAAAAAAAAATVNRAVAPSLTWLAKSKSALLKQKSPAKEPYFCNRQRAMAPSLTYEVCVQRS